MEIMAPCAAHGWHACCDIARRGKVYSQIVVTLSGQPQRI
jgi:hypothetical protein